MEHSVSAISRVMRRLSRITLVLLSTVAPERAVAQATNDRVPPLTAFDSGKARALLRDRLPCLGCHTLAGTGGIVGPDLTQLAGRRSPKYIAAMIENPQAVIPGTTMPRVAMPSAMRTLVTRYLGGDVAGAAMTRVSAAPSGAPASPSSESGAAIYARYCVACHGDRGRGDGPNASHLPVRPAAHADAALMSARSDDRLFDAIAGGGYPLGRSVAMPPFGGTLSRAQIWLLVGHVRTLCRCAGPAWARPATSRREHGANAP